MSKTVDELHEIFKDEQRALYFRAITTGETVSLAESERAGIAAVIRALRPKLLLWFHAIDQSVTEKTAAKFADDFIDEILGDAGEKVGTHGSPELDEDARKLEAMGQDPGMTIEEFLDEHFKPPATDISDGVAQRIEHGVSTSDVAGSSPAAVATDPAPAVCEWTLDSGEELFDDSFDTACGGKWVSVHNNPKQDGYNFCPSCGKPIRFVEAQR